MNKKEEVEIKNNQESNKVSFVNPFFFRSQYFIR